MNTCLLCSFQECFFQSKKETIETKCVQFDESHSTHEISPIDYLKMKRPQMYRKLQMIMTINESPNSVKIEEYDNIRKYY